MKRSVPAFTLLETLLALMIFSTAVVALVQAVNQLGLTTLHQRQESLVQERMRSLLTERTRLPLPSEEQMKVQEGLITYTVQHQKLELQNKDGQPVQELYEVRVTAEWMEGRERLRSTAETWVYPPLFYQPGAQGGLPTGLPQGVQPGTPQGGLQPRPLR